MPKYELPLHMTIGESYGPAMQIDDLDDATEYLAALVKWNIAYALAEGRSISEEDARCVQLANLGYYAGYYDFETRERVERLFGAIHPVFGSTKHGRITPGEAFRIGTELGRDAKDVP